jgi:hypothetical protein
MKVLAVAGDAGGASALRPVIRHLLKDRVPVTCLAYAEAFGLWEADGLHPKPVDGADLSSCDRLLLGTSVNKDQWELRCILQAQAGRIPTLSVLDFWVHYRERFTVQDGRMVLPGAIAVMDDQAKREMVELGFPQERLHITGQPAFDDLKSYEDPDTRKQASAEVRRLGDCREQEICILYVSQPLSQLWSREQLGFDEHEVFADLVQSLNSVLAKRSVRACLLVKLHPRECRDAVSFPETQLSHLRVSVIDAMGIDPRWLVLGSDLVCGMNSILLMDACLLRRPVLSYQPQIRIADSLPANRHGWSRAVYDRSKLESELDNELFGRDVLAEQRISSTKTGFVGGATERVVSLLEVAVAG